MNSLYVHPDMCRIDVKRENNAYNNISYRALIYGSVTQKEEITMLVTGRTENQVFWGGRESLLVLLGMNKDGLSYFTDGIKYCCLWFV